MTTEKMDLIIIIILLSVNANGSKKQQERASVSSQLFFVRRRTTTTARVSKVKQHATSTRTCIATATEGGSIMNEAPKEGR